MTTVSWLELATVNPELAAFGAERLTARPCYLATLRANGTPRVHPVTPVISVDGLFVFTEPTSPKARDLERRSWYALHNGVPDNDGTGGEFFLAGQGALVRDEGIRTRAAEAAGYEPADRYLLFELQVTEARCNGYGDTALPPDPRWPLRPNHT